MISSEARLIFLRRIHLFHDLKDDELAFIAGELKDGTWSEGARIFEQGSVVDRFYIIYQGGVHIAQTSRKEKPELTVLTGGDYFGEEELLAKNKSSATVTALEKSTFYWLPREVYLYI